MYIYSSATKSMKISQATNDSIQIEMCIIFPHGVQKKEFIPHLSEQFQLKISSKAERNLTNTNKQNGNFMHKEFLRRDPNTPKNRTGHSSLISHTPHSHFILLKRFLFSSHLPLSTALLKKCKKKSFEIWNRGDLFKKRKKKLFLLLTVPVRK